MDTQFENNAILVAPVDLKNYRFKGPISKGMWQKSSAIKSTYQDNFDYSVFDTLRNRFGENQPRGGVVFKTGLKLVNYHLSCTKCHYALEIDTYGRGCVHNCTYCYAKETLTQHGYWNQPIPFPVDIVKIRKTFSDVFETSKKSKWRDILEQRVPIRIGSMSDSFMKIDKKYKVTQELLQILNFYKYPYVIFTRSDLVAEEPYLSLLDKKLGTVQFSICSTSDEMTSIIEPGAPSLDKRYRAISILTSAGILVAVRLNPLIPTFPDGYFTDHDSIRERFGGVKQSPEFNFFDIRQATEFTERVAEAGTTTLIVGFARMSKYANVAISKSAKIDFRSFFRTDIPQDARDKRYTPKEIAYYYSILKNEADKSGLRFSTCYIGNGIRDYYAYQTTWADKTDCCDIRSHLQSFKNTSQTIPWSSRVNHTSDKKSAEIAREIDQMHDMREQFTANQSSMTEITVE